MFNSNNSDISYLSRSDTHHPLASYASNSFELDGGQWPTVEHYYQAMKFTDTALREQIRCTENPLSAVKLADKNKRHIRNDWKKIKRTIMTRGLYIMFRTHTAATQLLLASGNNKLVEKSQYDYYWGCGRDLRGENIYGEILMEIREKLKENP